MLPEQITTAEQLDQLPDRSVIVGLAADYDEIDEDAWQKIEGRWELAGAGYPLAFTSAVMLTSPTYDSVFVVWKPDDATIGTPRA